MIKKGNIIRCIQNKVNGTYDERKEMYLLNVLEIKLLSNCNLNCRGCYVYSNIANTDVYSIDEITTDLDILKEKFPEIREIRILGGEPLVLDNLMEYLELIHTRFPKTILTLVTNGIKLHSQNDEFFTYLSKIIQRKAGA